MLWRLPHDNCALPEQPGCLQPDGDLRPAAPHPAAQCCVQGLQLCPDLAAEAWTPPLAAVLHLTGAHPCSGGCQAPAGERAGSLSSLIPSSHHKNAHVSWQGIPQPVHQSQLTMTQAGALAAFSRSLQCYGWGLPGRPWLGEEQAACWRCKGTEERGQLHTHMPTSCRCKSSSHSH